MVQRIYSVSSVTCTHNAGIYGVQAAIAGETGKMITFIRHRDHPYELSYGTADVNIICNEEKPVPAEWITRQGSDIGDAFITYARPLIQGDVALPSKDGLPIFAYRK